MNGRWGVEGVIDRPITDQLEHDHRQAVLRRDDFLSEFLFQMASRMIASSLESRIELNDGVTILLFGLGVYQIERSLH